MHEEVLVIVVHMNSISLYRPKRGYCLHNVHITNRCVQCGTPSRRQREKLRKLERAIEQIKDSKDNEQRVTIGSPQKSYKWHNYTSTAVILPRTAESPKKKRLNQHKRKQLVEKAASPSSSASTHSHAFSNIEALIKANLQHPADKELQEGLIRQIKKPKICNDKSSSCVYFLVTVPYDGTCKIGYSDNTQRRIVGLQTGNSRKLVVVHIIPTEHATKLESALKHYMSLRRSPNCGGTEWFTMTQFEINKVASLARSSTPAQIKELPCLAK